MIPGTFSLVARDARTGDLGVSVATAVPAVGSVVPHVEIGVGAVATQARTNVRYGTKGLALLRIGLEPQIALDALLREDLDRESRQVIIIDNMGRIAAFTGGETIEWRGHIVGKDYATAGNMLVGSKVLEAMVKGFESTEGTLEERLMRALEAGQEAGGDKRGKRSAALRVAKARPASETRPDIDLRVDDHPEPVKELRRVFDSYMEFLKER